MTGSYFEFALLNPQTMNVYDRTSLKTITNVSVQRPYNSIGSFSFDVKYSLGDFEKLILSSGQMAQVLVYLNGAPYLQGTINNYTPNGWEFINVQCVEILAILTNDVIEGDFSLSNILSEYVPSVIGFSQADAKDDIYAKSYWLSSGNKLSYFSAYAGGLYLDEAANGIVSAKDNWNILTNRWLKANNQASYKCTVIKNGQVHSGFYFLMPELSYDAHHSNKAIGVRCQIAASGDGTRRLSIEYRNAEANPWAVLGTSAPIQSYMVGGAPQNLDDSLTLADITANYTFKADLNLWTFTAELHILHLGTEQVVSASGTLTPSTITNYQTFVCQAAIALEPYQGIGSYFLQNTTPQTLLSWLGLAVPSFRFVAAGSLPHPLDGSALRLSFTDADRWTIVKAVLQLAGPVSLQFIGIQNGKPTYAVHDYRQLPQLSVFIDGDDLADVKYEKQFADVYNVLVARANTSQAGNNITVSNKMTVTIKPSVQYPNVLGYTKKKIVTPSGIKDVVTLAQWAMALYLEHNKPTEAVTFKTAGTLSLLNAVPGQYVTVFGIPEGGKISEQISRVTIDCNTGFVTLELAKRVTLASELYQARLAANQ